MKSPGIPDPAIVEKIQRLYKKLLMEPSEKRLLEIAVDGVKDLPGVLESVLRIEKRTFGLHSIDFFSTAFHPVQSGEDKKDDNWCIGDGDLEKRNLKLHKFTLRTHRKEFGVLLAGIEDDGAFVPYFSLVENIADLVALLIEKFADAKAFIQIRNVMENQCRERTVALRKSERRQIEAQRIAKLGDFTWNVETGEVTWSRGMFDLLRYDPKEKIDYAKVNAGIHHPDDLPRVTKWLNDCIKSGKSELTPNEYRIIRKDGKTIYVRTQGLIERGKENETIVFATAQDITENVLAEKALRESEKRYHDTLESIMEGFQIISYDWCYLYVNSAVARHAQKAKEEMLGRTMMEVFPGIEETPLFGLLRHCMEERVPHFIEDEFTFTDGRKGWFDLRIEPAPDGIIVFSIDITERKKAEIESKMLQDQLLQAQKLESVGRLAGGVAHDLNNLFSPIIGYSEMLLEDLDPKEDIYELVTEILNAGFRARDLIQHLLAFSRKQTMQFKPVDLNMAVKRFEKLLRRTIPEDIKIEVSLSPNVPVIMMDVGQIEQVIMNLAVNAADAMSGGGILAIKTTYIILDEEYIALYPEVLPGQYVMLSVHDNGCGMDEEIRKDIFEPFFSTKGEQGTGLGLATVHGIVKQHNGHIGVDSEPGKGTIFKIYLPANSNQELTESKKITETILDLRGTESILLVEDNRQVCKLAQTILKRLGYTVYVTQDSSQAIKLLESHGNVVHLLLTDVVLPGMNGKELYNLAVKTYPDLKVLYMSGYSNNVIAHRGGLYEGVEFIQKPFTAQNLAAKVRQVLTKKKRSPI
ncbi:MAG: ATP-binding protein [Desulfobacteraceae bacterium]|jgi:PAS domain S-box-containing protein